VAAGEIMEDADTSRVWDEKEVADLLSDLSHFEKKKK
jgi:hypothetical protein